MPGPRLPVDVLKARGNKHLSVTEEAERRAGEVVFLAEEAVAPPPWLKGKKLRESFSEWEALLRKARIMSSLDADALARYLVAHTHWLKATEQLNKAFVARASAEQPEGEGANKEIPIDMVDSWSKIQERFFKQARGCATDLGLTITSRCRLVVPQGIPGPEENPFEKMKREREERRRNA